MRGGIDASVVIPTRDRPDDLERCLAALERQETRRSFEIVVVDDGSEPPLEHVEQEHPHVRVVRVDGVGPGPARNAGVAAARGPVVAFTDDDTEPAPTWLESAAASLERRPDLVGVEGPIESPPYDYLSELSLENESPGAFWTCNVAYRADALRRLGGFSSEFPYPHCEDRDLGYRALDSARSAGRTRCASSITPGRCRCARTRPGCGSRRARSCSSRAIATGSAAG
jgi:glycosyltransferase involved in cell wall biosynthesis